ncbi:hypothetical protein K438DRAFT_1759860 [Mycena galopus ATCC 62051]|nr:hypothetical protein K438DRAFT_1759860 [Mycena galopus ATCC 62051]
MLTAEVSAIYEFGNGTPARRHGPQAVLYARISQSVGKDDVPRIKLASYQWRDELSTWDGESNITQARCFRSWPESSQRATGEGAAQPQPHSKEILGNDGPGAVTKVQASMYPERIKYRPPGRSQALRLGKVFEKEKVGGTDEYRDEISGPHTRHLTLRSAERR